MPTCFKFLSTRYFKIQVSCISLTAICFLIIPHLAGAGSFRITPVKLFLDPGTKTTVIRVTNQGDESVTVQLDAKKWAQGETGPDRYTATKDIVFFPKIVTIEREDERIIRIGYQGKMNTASEQTYRLFLEELPVVKPGKSTLKFALTMGVPIFISPAKEIKKTSLEKLAFSGGALSVKVRNDGNRHIIVGDITASGLDGKGREVFKTTGNGWYVLAGAAKTFQVAIPEPDCQKASKLDVTVEVKRNLMRGNLILDKKQCAGNR